MISQNVDSVYKILNNKYVNLFGFLDYNNNFQLLISVILSAQTTDAQVNKVSPALFKKYPNPLALSNARQTEVEEIIHSTGFYRVKAMNIINCAKRLVEYFKSEVPDNMKDLLSLAGVGRKSANVILGSCFGQAAIIVDTHFRRVVNRLGFSSSQNPEIIEREVKSILEDEKQYRFSMIINQHGRLICKASKPSCKECMVKNYCNFYINLDFS